jgi:hypothetical protein
MPYTPTLDVAGRSGTPTFRTMQQQGIARPAPKAPAPSPYSPAYGQQAPNWDGRSTNPWSRATTGGINPQTGQPASGQAPGTAPGRINTTRAPAPPAAQAPGQQFNLPQQLMDRFKNPSAYNTDMATQTFDRLNSRLTEGFNTQRSQLEEEMARRGVSASSIYGGRMGDLGTQQARAQSDLAQQVHETAAKQQQDDWLKALQAMTGYDQQQQDNDYRDRTYNDQLDQTQWERMQAMLGY